MIKLEALRVFVTVAEVGNIKDAADQLCRTASAISMALKQLEEEVGGPLFETDRKSSLTALGSFMLQTSKIQIRNYDKAIESIRAYAQNKIGRLTLASVPSVAANLIPSILPSFVAARPEVEIELFDIDSRNVRSMVETGQADLGIAGKPMSDALVSFEPLFRDRFKVICSTTCRLFQIAEPLSWSDLEDEVLILNGAAEAIQAPQYQALSKKASMTVRNVTSLMALAKANLGFTLLPALATTGLPEGVAALELEDTTAIRMVGLLERRGATRSPVATAFHEFILEKMPAEIEQFGLERV